ncbi:MAG: hypothetical protein HGA86_05165, partial [Anaerolineaceae bacterium]|nr:hypothetical protein [Anaerolineaceae bacterium]
TVILLAASQYLMGFSKIGYNNLQALLVMSLVLWRAGVAVQTRRPIDYSWLGLVAGLCFYVYPAALYLLPLLIVFLLFFDLPNSRAAAGRWMMVASALFLMLLPVFVQPGYWQAKIAGTFIYTPGVVGNQGLGSHLISNMLYGIFSYLYIVNETHFVTSSYLDPLSAVFLPLGIAWLVKLFKKERFAQFLLVGFLVMLVLVGATHDRSTPSNTRMFLMLPFFMVFVSLGLNWLVESANRLFRSKAFGQIMLVVLLIAIVGLNIYQAYGVARQRTEGTPSLEMLFLRVLQRNQQMNLGDDFTYLFITSPDWGIDGFKQMQEAYRLPRASAQLQRVETSSEYLPADVIKRLEDNNLVIIVDPFMDEYKRNQISDELIARGRFGCALQDTPATQVVAHMFLHTDRQNLCPLQGNWELPQ